MFDNPCFDDDKKEQSINDSKLKINYRIQQKRQNSNSISPRLLKKSSDVPVIAPNKRRASSLFPIYLRRTDSINAEENNQNVLKEQQQQKEQENKIELDIDNSKNENLISELMTAHSTRCLEPFNGVNMNESQPRIENYITNFSNDFLNLNGLFGKEAKTTDFEPACLKAKTTGISPVKFNWFEGVFIRTSVNLLGVMLFMRVIIIIIIFKI